MPVVTPTPQGIEGLKQALKFVSDFTAQIAATKKFNILSALGFVDDLAELGVVITNWKQIVAEFNDLSTAERSDLYAYAQVVLQIPNADVKAFVADSFDWALKTFALVERARKLKK